MALVAHRVPRPSGSLNGAVTGLLVIVAALFSAATVNASPGSAVVPIVVAGALVALWVAIAHPTMMICAGVLAVPLEAFRPGAISPSAAVIGLAAVGGVVRWITSSPMTVPRHPAVIGFAALVIANGAGLVFALSPSNVARQLVVWGTLLIVVGSITQWASRRQVLQILLALAVCGGIAGLVAIVDPKPLTGVVFGGADVSRATGGFGSPNALGVLLVLTAPIQLVFALRGTAVTRVVGAVCFALAIAGMALAVSRGAFIGLGAALLVLAFWPPFRKAAFIVLPLVAVLSFAGNNPASPVAGKVVERLSEVKTAGSNNPRLVVWKAAPKMIGDRPVFGVGALNFGAYASAYGLRFPEGVPDHAHNLLLTTAIETGFVGLFSFLGMLAALAVGLRRVMRRATGMANAMGYALAASLAGFFVSGLLDDALGVTPIGVAFFVTVGCAAALSLKVEPERSREVARAPRPTLRPAGSAPTPA